MIEKKDKGSVTLYCVYTDENKSRLDAFMKELDGIIWFKHFILPVSGRGLPCWIPAIMKWGFIL